MTEQMYWYADSLHSDKDQDETTLFFFQSEESCHFYDRDARVTGDNRLDYHLLLSDSHLGLALIGIWNNWQWLYAAVNLIVSLLQTSVQAHWNMKAHMNTDKNHRLSNTILMYPWIVWSWLETDTIAYSKTANSISLKVMQLGNCNHLNLCLWGL